MTLGEKVDKYLGHWRGIIISDAQPLFEDEDLVDCVDDVMVRMIEIAFEQGGFDNWTDLIEEACRDCEVKEK